MAIQNFPKSAFYFMWFCETTQFPDLASAYLNKYRSYI